jgi:hypothetical protein
MNILCFASAAAMLEKVSKAVIHLNTPGVSIELYKSFEAVHQRLCQPNKSNCIAVLCLKNKKEIQAVTAWKDLFSETKLILVLTKRDQDAVKTAYKIFPRFLAFADEDFSDLARVVEKMSSRVLEQIKQTVAQDNAL